MFIPEKQRLEVVEALHVLRREAPEAMVKSAIALYIGILLGLVVRAFLPW